MGIKDIISWILYPINDIIWLFKLLCLLIKEIVTPIVSIFIHIYRFTLSLLKLIFYLPTISLTKLFGFLKDGVLCLYMFIKSIFAGFTMVKKVLIPAAKTTIEHRETTFNLIQLVT